MRERKCMDAADQLIVRYALSQRRDKLPKDLAGQIDNPTWSAQDLLDALHERATRDPEISKHFAQLLVHHPHSSRVGFQPHSSLGLKSNGSPNEEVGELEKFPMEAEKAMSFKRAALISRVEEAFFPETEREEKIDLDTYVKLMRALDLAKSLRGLKGIERDINQRLKAR